MNKLSAFNFISLNSCYKGLGGDISWHNHDEEGQEFSAENLRSGNTLLFGRVTYEMMYSFWPTRAAIDSLPEVAEGMNNAKKIVFSNTLKKTDWNNTKIIGGDIVTEVKKLKQEPGNNMTILGSGSILTLFAEHGLIDEYQLMLDPVAISNGTAIFSGIRHNINLQLTRTRTFKNGSVLLCYKPAGK